MFALLRDAGLLPPAKRPSGANSAGAQRARVSANGNAAPVVPEDSEVIKEKGYRGAYLRMGPGTHPVPKALFATNREKLVTHLKKTGHVQLPAVALLKGGEEVTRFDSDHEPVFRQESYFAYLFGVVEPGFYGTVDLETGASTLFIPRLPDEYGVFMGKIEDPEYYKRKYRVDAAYYVEELPKVLENRRLYVRKGLNSDSGKFSEPAWFEGMDKFDVDSSVLLHNALTECRVRKTALEIELLKYANRITSAAHVKLLQDVKPSMYEYQVEATFKYHVQMHGAMRNMAYTCICASGPNASVLHYGHAGAPNDRELESGDMMLCDLGAEYSFYASDITCSFPVNGKFSEEQKGVYNLVLAAQKAVLGQMKAGTSWPKMHRLAERHIIKGLIELGLLIGDIEQMLEAEMGAVFMPHGLGHLMGIDTHDVGGYIEGVTPDRIQRPGIRSLRTARTLEEGMVITVEPGCYFIKSCLDKAQQDDRQKHFLNMEEIEKFSSFGGVRIEDNVLVTANGIDNFSNVPRTIEEIEAVMAGAAWPLQ
mmetsp:Transcript_1684/g.5908  ORF Transcript_1684/g.5908 Transcript_1684/m.5908 type:complete len:536 (+) Transcript_1684:92-1699(+)